MVTLAVLAVIAGLGVIAWRIWAVRAGRRKAIEALMLECPGLDDRLDGQDATLLFSGHEEMVGIASHKVTKLLPFSIIRKWRVEPVYNSADKRVGWNFIIETADTLEPIWTIRMRSGPGNAMPNFWMAKFSAHLNG
ncbi:hypothetical protein J8J14_17340 [Roseomonas sp. SSH11]|uniref:DUF2550 family protein n=1 Tax=Pararoseomonas baculiformis TaxID=2820812 RepID=A0ABS4AHP1_9PROT|nr:hypothetical protein [Pararoseomonas baculiformis]MBP0446541.1 hypothetical protein [Pararoseomonas baculiformis]